MSLNVSKFRRSPVFVVIAAGILCALGSISVHGQTVIANDAPKRGALRIYIPPQNGFESYLSAAIVKKHVPVIVTESKEDAQFVLTSAVLAKEENAGSKVARCLFMYCLGVEGSQTATVQLVNAKTQDVAWAYNVRKGSAQAYQSTAEAVAKHLKHFLEDHPQ